jgi:hypothetical protein
MKFSMFLFNSGVQVVKGQELAEVVCKMGEKNELIGANFNPLPFWLHITFI